MADTKPDTAASVAPPPGSPIEVRVMRVITALAVVGATITLLPVLLSHEVPTKADIYVSLLVGFLTSKSGTIIDWQFGGSESGTRRADQLIHQAAPPAGGSVVITDSPSDVTVKEKDGDE